MNRLIGRRRIGWVRVVRMPVLCCLLLVVPGTLAARVAADRSASSGPTLSATAHTVVPRQRINLSVSGFQPGELIVLSLDGHRLTGTDTANGQGVVRNAYAYVPSS